MDSRDLEWSFTTFLHGGPDDDGDDLDRATAGVTREWNEIGTVGAARSGPAPPGARGVDPAQVGAIVAAIAPGGLVAALNALWQWVDARRGRTVEVVLPSGASLKVTHATPDEQRALIAAWIAEGVRA